jgi:hypothetical protein
VLPETNNDVAVAALTNCSIGIIEHKNVEQLIAQYPSLGLALWRASMRREAVGINGATIPLTQMDLADAAGLSIVHVKRTFQELRRLDILSKEGRTIKVVNRKRLAILAGFDGNYLNMPQLLAHWHVKMDSAAVTGGSRNSATSSSLDIGRLRGAGSLTVDRNAGTGPGPWRVSSLDRAGGGNAKAAAGPRGTL